MSATRWMTIMVAMLLAARLAAAEEPVANQDLLRARLEQRITQRLAAVDGVVGLWIKDLASGDEIGINEDCASLVLKERHRVDTRGTVRRDV